MLLLALGCGGGTGNQPELVPVGGTITLDNEPLAGAVVSFIPQGATPGNGGSAVTDASGNYRLSTRDARTGVPAGEYKVIVTKLVMPDGSALPPDIDDATLMGSGAKQIVPLRYSDPEQTTLKATVPAGGTTADFQLQDGR